MRTYLKIKSPWSQLSVFLLAYAGTMILTSSVAMLIMMSKGVIISGKRGMDAFDLNDPAVVSLLKWIQGASSIGIYLLTGMIYAWFSFRHRPIWFLGFHKPEKTVFYALALGLALLSFPLAGWLGEVNQHIPLPASLISAEKDADKQVEAFMKAGGTTGVLSNLFVMALLPAICEEACFRGSLQRILIHLFKSPWLGILVAAALFSAFHFQFQGFLPRFFLGVVLGALYWYSGSLWVSILAHFVINGVQVLVASGYSKTALENASIPVYMVILSAVLTGFLLKKLAGESWMTYAKVYEVDAVNEYNQFLS
ncbi:MAG: CPBP family intramembrane metalloprotease [Puia sp.]|nr:CPBP family intramembrane metalloprotease [Puia sp.]